MRTMINQTSNSERNLLLEKCEQQGIKLELRKYPKTSDQKKNKRLFILFQELLKPDSMLMG